MSTPLNIHQFFPFREHTIFGGVFLFNNKMAWGLLSIEALREIAQFHTLHYFHGCHTSISRVIRMALCANTTDRKQGTGTVRGNAEWLPFPSTYNVVLLVQSKITRSLWMNEWQDRKNDLCLSISLTQHSNIICFKARQAGRRGVANGGTIS